MSVVGGELKKKNTQIPGTKQTERKFLISGYY